VVLYVSVRWSRLHVLKLKRSMAVMGRTEAMMNSGVALEVVETVGRLSKDVHCSITLKKFFDCDVRYSAKWVFLAILSRAIFFMC
jgi:hypothetical protein